MVLALIIFMWAKGFLAERTLKFSEPIENSCERINFDAEILGEKLGIVNKGNVPIYGVEIRKKGFGSIENVGVFDTTITIGDSARIDIGNSFNIGEGLIIVPIILGESGGAKKTYVCEEKYGMEVIVG
jgi:hypothetical protein